MNSTASEAGKAAFSVETPFADLFYEPVFMLLLGTVQVQGGVITLDFSSILL